MNSDTTVPAPVESPNPSPPAAGPRSSSWKLIAAAAVIIIVGSAGAVEVALYYIGGGFGANKAASQAPDALRASTKETIRIIHNEAADDYRNGDYSACMDKYNTIIPLLNAVGPTNMEKQVLDQIYWNISLVNQAIGETKQGAEAVALQKKSLEYAMKCINETGDRQAYWLAGDADLALYRANPSETGVLMDAYNAYSVAVGVDFKPSELATVYLRKAMVEELLGDAQAGGASAAGWYNLALADYAKATEINSALTIAGESRDALSERLAEPLIVR